MPRHNFARPRGSVVEIDIDSIHLRRNMLGDPSSRAVAVYLPPGYEDSDADYPLLVDLAAFTSSGLKRLAWTAFGESVPQRIDRLVHEGAMGPVIVAFPDAFTSLGGNQYVDSPVFGDWEQFIVEDLLPTLEQRFRVRAGAKHRAVLGKSSGGYGALRQGLLHGEHWGAVACHSGDMAFDLTVLRDFPAAADRLTPHRGDLVGFVRSLQDKPKIRGGDFHVLMTLALAASYDPDPAAPMGLRLPFDLHTCELDPQRWDAWMAHDPIVLADDLDAQNRLRNLAGLFIDCGRRDQYFLHFGARQLHRKLEIAGIAHTYEEFDDDHSSIDYRLDRSLPFLFSAIA